MELEVFIEKFAEQFIDTDASEITADLKFKGLEEWDSLTALGVIAMVKTETGKKITGSQIRSCETVRDLYNMVESL